MLRRRLLRALAATSVLPRLTRGAPAIEASAPDVQTLQALAAAVLPESLGKARVEEIAARFLVWLRGYMPGADKGYGYGHPKLQTAPASPADAYALQLAALERAAKQTGAASFAGLGGDKQRELVDAALKAAKVERLPTHPDGGHVASDLLAFFFRSSAANDLCYRAEIGRETCRGLADSAERPRPLTSGS
jgi:hypothetical protein